MYRITKQNTRGFYSIDVDSDSELLEHLSGMFRNTDHKLIAVFRLTPVVGDAACAQAGEFDGAARRLMPNG